MTEACVVKRNPGQSTAKIHSMEQAILTARKNRCLALRFRDGIAVVGDADFSP